MKDTNEDTEVPEVQIPEKEYDGIMSQEPGELVVGLDIGTTKICCVVGEILEDRIDVIGVGTAPSQGLKKGVVINIESTVSSIQRAVALAEDAANVDLSSVYVYVGIAGNHIKGFNSPGILAINNREIKQADIDEISKILLLFIIKTSLNFLKYDQK